MEPTKDQIIRLKKDWEKEAKEAVEIEQRGSAIYGFCSELASLRIAYKYRRSAGTTKAGYSENLNKWYFRLEIHTHTLPKKQKTTKRIDDTDITDADILENLRLNPDGTCRFPFISENDHI